MSCEHHTKDTNDVWYSEGLRFTCVEGCARCCGGAPGDVFVSREELEKIAAFLKQSVEDFEYEYIRHYADGRLSIKERRNGDCLLLNPDGKGCSIYDVRPRQCRDYPFWPELVANPGAWQKETLKCPGLGQGELHSAPKIIEMVRSQTNA